jgi:hypothetical protein
VQATDNKGGNHEGQSTPRMTFLSDDFGLPARQSVGQAHLQAPQLQQPADTPRRPWMIAVGVSLAATAVVGATIFAFTADLRPGFLRAIAAPRPEFLAPATF